MELKKLVSESAKVKVFENGDKCVKIFKEPDEPKSVVFYEALTHTRVEETGFAKMPEIIGATKVDGKWALEYSFIKGKTLDEIMHEQPRSEELLGKMADLHVEVNSLHSAKLSRLKDYLKRSIEGLDMIDDVKKYELLTKLASAEDSSCVCHGEFMPENIVVNENGMYVVDWFKAKQGNPLADVARTYLGFCLRHRTESAEKYLKLYCQKAQVDKKKVQDWLPIVAAAQLKFKRPEERELLLTWIDIAEFFN